MAIYQGLLGIGQAVPVAAGRNNLLSPFNYDERGMIPFQRVVATPRLKEKKENEEEEKEKNEQINQPVMFVGDDGPPTSFSDETFSVGYHEGHPTMRPETPFESKEYEDFVKEYYSDPAKYREMDLLSIDQADKHAAKGYAQSIYDAMKADRPSLFSAGLLENPVSTISNYMSRPENIMGAVIGAPTSSILEAVSNYNMKNQAYNRALGMQGVPGYSYGMLDGQHYSTAPHGLMGHRVMYGTVPDWFDVDAADALENYSRGLDVDGNPTIDVGTARFSPDGFLSTPFGHDVATPEDIEALAREYGLTYEETLDAVNRAESGDGDLESNLGGSIDTSFETGVAGTDISSDEIKWDPVEQGDDVDPDADFSDMMDEEHSPW
jgi:hypothetical protein